MTDDQNKLTLTKADNSTIEVEVQAEELQNFTVISAQRTERLSNAKELMKRIRTIVTKDEPTATDLAILQDKAQDLEREKQMVLKFNSAMVDCLDDSGEYDDMFLDWSHEIITNIDQWLRRSMQLLRRNGRELKDIPLNTTLADVTVTEKGAVKESQVTTSSKPAQDKLPRKDVLESIKFLGTNRDYHRWKTDALNLFGESTDYTYVSRFWCLKQCVPEKMVAMVASYESTQAGFTKFWADMEESYGSRADQKAQLVRELENLPSVPENNGRVSCPKLEEYYIKARKIIRELAVIGETGSANYRDWKPILNSKLPQKFAAEWNEKYEEIKKDKESDVTDDTDPIDEQLVFVKAKLDILRTTVTEYKTMESRLKPSQSNKNQKAKPEQNYAVSTRAQTKAKNSGGTGGFGNPTGKAVVSKNPEFCYLCNKGNKKESHHPKHCKKPEKDSYARLYKASACSSCGNIGHTPKFCKNSHECNATDDCKFKHMAVLHNIKWLSYNDYKSNNSNSNNST